MNNISINTEKFFEKLNKSLPSPTCRPQFIRVEYPVDNIDPLGWLENQHNPTRIYWKSRDGRFEAAGIGIAHDVSGAKYGSLEQALETIQEDVKGFPPGLRYYGGIAFDQSVKQEPMWKSLGNFYFFIPAFEVVRTPTESKLAVNIFCSPQTSVDEITSKITNGFEKLKPAAGTAVKSIIKITGRDDHPGRKTWIDNINKLLDTIKSGKLKKIVLARKTVISAGGKLNSIQILRNLIKINQRTYNFLFQPRSGLSIIGCSPERLFKKQGRTIFSEVLAGSIKFRKGSQQEKASSDKLLSSEKDLEEHRYVFDKVHNDLITLCKKIKILKKMDIMTLSYIQHIYSKFSGELKGTSDFLDILTTLHPTPAVFGFPEEDLMSSIKEYEPFERGWYASPLGWISREEADFSVCIRSGFLSGKKICLYSGAGIVADSVPEQEWDEIENKISHFIKALE